MQVFDFDKTIYDGDSTANFYRFCLKRSVKLCLLAPWHVCLFLPYKLHLCRKKTAKQHFYRFLRHVPDIKAQTDAFWQENIGRIKRWYKDIQRPDDVVISASPRFLLTPACERLGIKTLICSEVDPETGVYAGENCDGGEKVRRYRKMFAQTPVGSFYSDSFDDDPMAQIAEKAYAVRGEKLFPWGEYFGK